MLERILVLAIAQESSRDDTKPKVVNAVTLELTPDQAEKLDLARSVGTLSLVLRNQIEDKPVNTEGATKSSLLDEKVAMAAPAAMVQAKPLPRRRPAARPRHRPGHASKSSRGWNAAPNNSNLHQRSHAMSTYCTASGSRVLSLALALAMIGALAPQARGEPVAATAAAADTGAAQQQPRQPPVPSPRRAQSESRAGRTEMAPQMSLAEGKSTLMRLPFAASRMSVGDPRIADVILLNPNEVYLLGTLRRHHQPDPVEQEQ